MATIDWSAMTPREVYDFVQSAPKVAGEWFGGPDADAHRFRITPEGTRIAFVVRINTRWRADSCDSQHDTRDAAMAAADAELTRRGWLLVDKEKR